MRWGYKINHIMIWWRSDRKILIEWTGSGKPHCFKQKHIIRFFTLGNPPRCEGVENGFHQLTTKRKNHQERNQEGN